MYRCVAFVTNLWMRLFPNYKEYFFYSSHAQVLDDWAYLRYCELWNRSSTISRGYLLPEQWNEIKAVRAQARMLDEIARNQMRPITVKALKYSHESKQCNSAYNNATKESK